ncbi:[4Fe-4S] proteins maturation [Coemansia nantahalensis]|uniref:[4Fe-4S] proteins maturation n=1 Tax=Coemansia nantahalensis TaxID=2789366 RepID=A0ACC1JZ10_9FUNG|nr:[4Fe-4S] proteins maturation [Coemansia nantahalensis]KAJ2771069.1 [4Fe-4S] proteins maturation [Coemansia nantahalensis]
MERLWRAVPAAGRWRLARGTRGTAVRWNGSSSSAVKYSLQQLDTRPPVEQGSPRADAVELTAGAVGRLRHLSERRGKTQYLRLRVDSGGCYGFSYMLDMTETPEADDVVVDRDGAKMVIDAVSLPLVRGAIIDWRDELIGQAFYVRANPNASGGCGCGSSFEIKMD